MFENRLQYENCREHKYFENCKKYFVSADVVLVWASNVRLFLPFGVSKNDIYLRICAIELIYSFSKNVCVFDFIFYDVDLLSTIKRHRQQMFKIFF